MYDALDIPFKSGKKQGRKGKDVYHLKHLLLMQPLSFQCPITMIPSALSWLSMITTSIFQNVSQSCKTSRHLKVLNVIQTLDR